MFLRKIYIKISIFLYSIRKPLSTAVITLIALSILYSLINNFLLRNIILSKADNYQINKKCSNAILLYNLAYSYYGINHISPENKKTYIDIPYKISMCYFIEGKKQKSIDAMVKGLTSTQENFGEFSKENAYFIRKYLITYYLDNNRYGLAKKEFDNLLLIYKQIGFTNSEMADMLGAAGDLYYYQKNYDEAIKLYKQAYEIISVQNDIDYEIFANIVNRICDYQIKTNNAEEAASIYKSSISLLENSGKEQQNITVAMLLNLGNLYIEQSNYKEAIICYEKIITIIKKLPRNNYFRQNAINYLNTLKVLYTNTYQYQKANDVEQKIIKIQRFSFLF